MDADRLNKTCTGFVVGWQVNVPAGFFELQEADHLVLAIDAPFPTSQLRVFAPAAGSDYRWPHVEQGGLLCLPPSKSTAPIADRVVTPILSG